MTVLSTAVALKLIEAQVCATVEAECRERPFADDIDGLIAEAKTMMTGQTGHEVINDIFGLMMMRDIRDRFELPVDMAGAREALLRIRISARTGVYPRYLLTKPGTHQG